MINPVVKKVLIAQRMLKDKSSGIQRNVLEHIRYLTEQNLKVYVCAQTKNSKLIKEQGGIVLPIFSLPMSNYYKRRFFNWQCQFWIKWFNINCVIGHGDIIQQDIASIHNCVHLANERIFNKSLPTNHSVGRNVNLLFSQNQFQILICNSHLVKNDLVKRFNINKQVEVIYPECDLTQFSNLDKPIIREQFRKEQHFAPNDFVIGLITSGNFKKRNVDFFIDVIHYLSQNNNQIKAIISGKNKDKYFEQKINQLGLAEKIKLCPCIKEVEKYYYSIDLFVLPAFIEEFGRSVLEAMACELPVLISDFVGAGEILPQISHNFIIKNFDVKVYAQKIQLIIQDKKLRQTLSSQNKFSATHCNSDQQNRQFFKLVQQVIQSKQ